MVHRALLVLLLALAGGLPVASPAAAAPTWVPFADAAIHPGVRTVTEGGGQCTANFVFTDDAGAVYLGQSAHCGSTSGSTQADGCQAGSVPLGTPVEVGGATRPGVLAYSSWLAMQDAGEADPLACGFNDFALVRLDPADHGRINPSLPHYGGPHGIVATTAEGDPVYTYGASSLRPTEGDSKSGTSRGQGEGGWSHDVFTLNVGVPGDSGSGFLDGAGRAFGTLSTLELLPSPGSNGVSDLTLQLAYLAAHGGPAVRMADGTLQFDPSGATVDTAPGATSGEEGAQTVRLMGASRIETAVAASRDRFADGAAGAVVLGRADVAADALAGTPLAAASAAPLLLTPADRLHPATSAEIRRVLPAGGTVHLLGGTGALSAAVADDLDGYDVRRHAGPSRFETAVAVARATTDAPTQVLLADGLGFAEALVAGPAAAGVGGVVLLTDGTLSHPAVDAYLAAHPDAEVVTIGPAAAQAHPGRRSIAGEDAAATSAAVAAAYADRAPVVGIARLDAFADALAGGAHAASRGAPILLTGRDALPDAVRAHLVDRAAAIDLGVVYGGPSAVAEAVAEQIRDAIG